MYTFLCSRKPLSKLCDASHDFFLFYARRAIEIAIDGICAIRAGAVTHSICQQETGVEENVAVKEWQSELIR